MEILFGLTIPAIGGWVELSLACASFVLAIACIEMRANGKRGLALTLGVIAGIIFGLVFGGGATVLLLPSANVGSTDYKVVTGVNLFLACTCTGITLATRFTRRHRFTALAALPVGPTLVVGTTALMHLVSSSADQYLAYLADAGIVLTLAAIAGCIATGVYLLGKRLYERYLTSRIANEQPLAPTPSR